jgi:hypothetical protein
MEYHSVSPLLGIGSPASECAPARNQRGVTAGKGVGVGGVTIPTKGEKAYHSVYSLLCECKAPQLICLLDDGSPCMTCLDPYTKSLDSSFAEHLCILMITKRFRLSLLTNCALVSYSRTNAGGIAGGVGSGV